MRSVNLYTVFETNSNYKLLELTTELLESFKEGDVYFKAFDSKSELVICSKDKTWIAKQKKHSNLVMVMKNFVSNKVVPEDRLLTFGLPYPQVDYLGYSYQSSEIEARLVKGKINIGMLPIYKGVSDFSKSNIYKISIQDLMCDSACSEKEFYDKWYKAGGCEIDELACILNDDLITRGLHITLMSILAECLDNQNLKVERICECIARDIVENETSNPYSIEVINTILHKFGTKNEDDCTFKLDLDLISQWYGICALKKFAFKEPVSVQEFMIKWKSLFPPFFNSDLDLEFLHGEFARPFCNMIQYVPKNTLPTDVKDRFNCLFKIQSTWELKDMIPFVEDLNCRGLTIESFIMKYTRRKKVGKSVVITSR